MDCDDDDASEKAHSHRDFKPGNIGPDGDYVVGKGRPPKSTRFAVGDGRKRGRRPKGQRNLDTEFTSEAFRLITVRENGKERRVTKLRATIIRAFGNASSGQNQAINTILTHSARIGDKPDNSSLSLTTQEDAILNAWLNERLAALATDDESGDREDDVAEEMAREAAIDNDRLDE